MKDKGELNGRVLARLAAAAFAGALCSAVLAAPRTFPP